MVSGQPVSNAITHLALDRFLHLPTGTIGVLTDKGMPLAFTLEPPVASPESIIPAGRYRINWKTNGRIAGLYRRRGYPGALEVMNVPGRTAIELHAGNTAADTEGCILLGLSMDDIRRQPLTILRSRQAADAVYQWATPHLERGAIHLHVMPVVNLPGRVA